MHRDSKQYRFARIEGYRITLARLKAQFKDRAINLEKMEAAVAEHLTQEGRCAPWRRSESERAGCREGMRLAALEFLSQYRACLASSGGSTACGASASATSAKDGRRDPKYKSAHELHLN